MRGLRLALWLLKSEQLNPVQTLRNWVAQDDVDAGRTTGLTTAERARMRELERENRKLREEREILRKAAAFFATERERR